MRRKLTIAAALIHSPRILFLDEPTTGIDVESARQIRSLILAQKAQGTTVFLTTHYLEEAERLCNDIAIIVKGRIAANGTVAELMDGETTFEDAFVKHTGMSAVQAGHPAEGGDII